MSSPSNSSHSGPAKRKDPPDDDEDEDQRAVERSVKVKPDDNGDGKSKNEHAAVMPVFGDASDDDNDVDEEKNGKLPATDSEVDDVADDDFDVQEDEDRLIREETTTKTLNGGTYTFHSQLLKFVGTIPDTSEGVREINVKLYFELSEKPGKAKRNRDDDDEPVGYLTAFWLPRPVTNGFHEMADSVSDELAELAAMFCNRRGHVTRIDTGLRGLDVTDGGLLQIYSLEVKGPGHAGKCDLGLHLVHETLKLLKDEWNIAVMVPLLLGVHIQQWPTFHNRLTIDPHAHEHSKEQTEGLKAAHVKIKRHFARMGFVQAGRNSEHHHAWYLTAPAYFGKDNTARDGEKAMKQWKSKQEVESLDIFVAPDKHQPDGVDAELHDLVVGGDSPNPDTVRKLVQKRKASIHRSRALFVAAANNDSSLLKLLVEELKGNVNETDENRNTPLHVAAMMLSLLSIEYLVGHGARKDSVHDKGHTPLQTAQESINTMLDEGEDDHSDSGEVEVDSQENQRKCLELLRID
eukprot:scaffold765_cov160-Amphora_coffeaeformis.AAC.10